MLVLLVAFLSGMLSVLTPCVLPLLPAILASTTGGGRRRPIGIVVGLVGSFTIALLAFSAVVRALGTPADTLRWIAATMLVGFGLVLLVPPLERWFEHVAGKLGRFAPTRRSDGDGLWSGIAVGAGLGLVWAPCVGPILGGVAVASSTATTGADHVIRAVSFAIGMCIPLLAIVFGGRRISGTLRQRINPKRIQAIAGLVFVITGLVIATGFDTRINSFLSRTTGISSTLIAGLESDVLEDGEQTQKFAPESPSGGADGALDDLGAAPKFSGITQWINTPGERPLDIEDLRGKVVLVDFWTYSCINCLRTLPYIHDWHEKYKDDGLVIVGVHAPEFEFEKDEGNVRRAIEEHDIEYPVAMDNDFATWRNYDNRYWPAKYLIDRDGRVRYTHFGEGEYDVTEQNIRTLLALDEASNAPATSEPEANLARTPETYVGYDRAANLATRIERDVESTYDTPPNALDEDQWAFDGAWTISGERAVAGTGASIVIHYRAADVHLVLGPVGDTPGTVTVRDGANGTKRSIKVDGQRLYTLRAGDTAQNATMRIDIAPGIAAYAFTFG